MIEGQSVLAVIPARGGSKGVPRKNLRDVAGRPLIAWTIAAARGSSHIDRLVLSSDDEEIMETARRHGCDVPFRRPAELATDEADSMAVVMHAVETLAERYDYVVLLQPTSPLRASADIDGAIATCLRHMAPSCVTVCRT
jgi:N-acylneuraminate cytidylyltransferase